MTFTNAIAALLRGGAAGLVGATVRVGIRTFDERYAPLTVAPAPRPSDGKALGDALTGGVLAGAVYGLVRGHQRYPLSLRDGAALGASLYAASWLVRLTASCPGRPPWQVPFPQHAGALLRYVAYGVTTAATFAALSHADRRHDLVSAVFSRSTTHD
jgi:hypothetical protein